MRNKFVTYLPLILLSVVAVASLSFAEVERSETRCTNVIITIEKNAAHSDFVTNDDVYEIINANRNMLIGREIREFDISKIELMIESNPMILDCETFFTLCGELHIVIKQRTPIMRVVAQNNEFYLDENGFEMPLSNHASARVLVASGEINEHYEPNACVWDLEESKNLQDMFRLAQIIRKDEIFLPMIEQIYVTPQGEFVLGSKVGPARIEFGTMDDYDTKFRHLRAFFTAEKVRENWNLYKSLSLKYKNQIVCTKK